MAGRLPGVGVLPRRRSSEHHHQQHHRNSSNYLTDSLEISDTTANLDETAIKARQRLHNKLRHFFSSFRSSDNPPKKEASLAKKDAGLGRKLLESSWLLRSTKFKKERKVCAVCLEDFQQKQQVMNLSCSHKYHSACLLPWLAAHPHCPCCRTSVKPKP